jgi:hypothetical protein
MLVCYQQLGAKLVTPVTQWEFVMSITAISSTHPTVLTTPAKAADGDSADVEAAESAATKRAEKANGGIAPKAIPPVAEATAAPSAETGGVDKLV